MDALMNVAVAVFFLSLIMLFVGWRLDRWMVRDLSAWPLHAYEGPGFFVFMIGFLFAAIDAVLWTVFGLLTWIGALG